MSLAGIEVGPLLESLKFKIKNLEEFISEKFLPSWASRKSIPVIYPTDKNSVLRPRELAALAAYGKVPICPDNIKIYDNDNDVLWGSLICSLKSPLKLPDGTLFNKCFVNEGDFLYVKSKIEGQTGSLEAAGFKLGEIQLPPKPS